MYIYKNQYGQEHIQTTAPYGEPNQSTKSIKIVTFQIHEIKQEQKHCTFCAMGGHAFTKGFPQFP